MSVKVKRNTDFLNTSQEIRNSARIHKGIIDMQGSFRGHLLSQDSSFLDGYNVGLNELPILFSEQQLLEIRRKARYLDISYISNAAIHSNKSINTFYVSFHWLAKREIVIMPFAAVHY